MSGLTVNTELCIGCGLCVKACATDGIRVEGPRGARLARTTDTCVLCGSCVSACPKGALAIEKDELAGEGPSACQDIWVVVQAGEDMRPLPVAFELLTRARELASVRGEDCRVVAVLPLSDAAEGDVADKAARALIQGGAYKVLRCCDGRFAAGDAGVHAAWIASLARDRCPEVILFGATAFGRELAPAVAQLLQTGLTADCTQLELDPETGLLQQTRPAFGGNLMATIVCPAHRPQMATVRPGVFAAAEPDSARTGRVRDLRLDPSIRPRLRIMEHAHASAEPSITEADVLVVVGRGIGSKKNLPLMRELAEKLGGELGCTRPVVEAGWLEYRHQVGQTGVAVAPKLLISVGVSGAIQHLAGIAGAETIVAINEDASAPIMSVATYKVVGDCIEVVQALLAQL